MLHLAVVNGCLLGVAYAWGLSAAHSVAVKAAHKKILMKEVEALTALKHENIVAMTDHMDDDKNLAMCLEFLDGGGLLERLNEVEHYSEAEAAELFGQMLAAVAYMHSQNFIHRDIKPENMVFSETPQSSKMKEKAPCLKLVDFGLARLHHTSRSVKSRLGSPGFMSPEVCGARVNGNRFRWYHSATLL